MKTIFMTYLQDPEYSRPLELNKWTPGDLKPVGIRFTWHFLKDDLSAYISSRYFITIKT